MTKALRIWIVNKTAVGTSKSCSAISRSQPLWKCSLQTFDAQQTPAIFFDLLERSQVGDGPGGLFDRATFDRKHQIARTALANLNDFCPVDDAIPAGAANGCSSDFAALIGGLLDGN